MDQLAIIPVSRAEAAAPRIEAASPVISTDKPFIQANTIEVSVDEITTNHIIPVFAKDNEPLIGHGDFIQGTARLVEEYFAGEQIRPPSIRVSHPIKGRVPEARNKPAEQLSDWEKTIYYERMAFVIEVPSISDVIDGNRLSLTIGGVKAYNLDNIHGKKGADERFKMFIGFQNKVCTNLCVWSDGAQFDVAVRSLGQLMAQIKYMIEYYNQNHHLYHLKKLTEYSLTEHQFATLVGRCRMYNQLPPTSREGIPPLLLGDTQLNTICREYYREESFCRNPDGSISLWRLYNLLTSANKSTYIDSFVERASNAYDFTYNLKLALDEQQFSWYLS